MEPWQSRNDQAIWELACNEPFMPPPRQWTFEDGAVKFGCDHYHVDRATLCELALLDIHSQYWETTSPEYLRKYHRGLQYNVEHIFQTESPTSTYHTPPFLRPWLLRVIFMKPHNSKGREMVDYILNNVSQDEKLKLQTGNFLENGMMLTFLSMVVTCAYSGLPDWITVISHKDHHTGLSQMINTICSEREISQNSITGYSWSLPIFSTITYENHDHSSTSSTDLAVPLYKHEIAEQKWQGILDLSISHVWTIARVPFQNTGIKRLLHGRWLDDDIIDAYLGLCKYLCPNIKFISTQWFPLLQTWGLEASSKSVAWVSLPFQLH